MDWDAEIERFVATDVDESRVLEFKREVNLSTRDQKLEALKDLTAMANGGGGVVVFVIGVVGLLEEGERLLGRVVRL